MHPEHDRGRQRVLVPDLSGAPLSTLRSLEVVLLMLDGWEIDPDDPIGRLPEAISGGRGIDVVARLLVALWPTQEQTARTHGRLLASPGDPRNLSTSPEPYEHIPLTEVLVETDDVVRLAALAQALGHPGLDPRIPRAVAGLAADGVPDLGELVEEVARLSGLLDLAWTQDAEGLAPRLRERGPGRDVVLSESEQDQYERLADRINQMITGDELARRLY